MKPKLILMGVAGALALTVVWYIALWSPQSDKLDKARTERTAAEAKADQSQLRLTKLKKLEANADVMARDRDRLAAKIPDADRIDTFIIDLNRRATESGVALASISPQDSAANAAPAVAGAKSTAADTIGLQLQVKGNYQQVLRFVDSVRDGDRLVTVETMSLATPDATGALTATIGGRMFVSHNTIAAAAPAGGS